MFPSNGLFAQLTALLRAKYGNPFLEVTPEQAEVTKKLLRIFSTYVVNANVKSFDLRLRVDNYVLNLLNP